MAFCSRWMTPDDTRSNTEARGRSFDRNSASFGRSGRAACLAIGIVAALITSCERTHRVEESSEPQPAASHGEQTQRIGVSSTALQSVGYDEDSQTLEIKFTSGAVYQYFEVPPEVYRGLMAAESHGRYFHQHVRSAGYGHQRMTTSNRGAAMNLRAKGETHVED